jgi:hypothetical protein
MPKIGNSSPERHAQIIAHLFFHNVLKIEEKLRVHVILLDAPASWLELEVAEDFLFTVA